MEERGGPHRIVSILRTLLLVWCLVPLTSHAGGGVRHLLFGLDSSLAYDVVVGGCPVAIQANPGPSGELAFVAATAGSVLASPSDLLAPGANPGAPARGDAVSEPTPNPARDTFDLKIVMDQGGEVRISIIEAATGRSRHVVREDLPRGENRVRISLPARLASGCYLVWVEAGGETRARKLHLLRGGSRVPNR